MCGEQILGWKNNPQPTKHVMLGWVGLGTVQSEAALSLMTHTKAHMGRVLPHIVIRDKSSCSACYNTSDHFWQNQSKVTQ